MARIIAALWLMLIHSAPTGSAGMPSFSPVPEGTSCDILDIGSCPAGNGCYIDLNSGSAICAVPSDPGQQNDDCMFLNQCEIGLGCVLNSTSSPGLACAHYCDPANGVTAGGQQCGDIAQISTGTPRCVAFAEFYSNVTVDGGMCVDCDDYPSHPPCDRLFRNGFESPP